MRARVCVWYTCARVYTCVLCTCVHACACVCVHTCVPVCARARVYRYARTTQALLRAQVHLCVRIGQRQSGAMSTAAAARLVHKWPQVAPHFPLPHTWRSITSGSSVLFRMLRTATSSTRPRAPWDARLTPLLLHVHTHVHECVRVCMFKPRGGRVLPALNACLALPQNPQPSQLFGRRTGQLGWARTCCWRP